MAQSTTGGRDGAGNSDPAPPAPQYYDLSAPLTRPVTTLQVTGFVLREGMLPSLVTPDGSLYFGPTAEDGKYRVPSGCGIIFFHHDESIPPTFVKPNSSSSTSDGGLVSYFFGRGIPRDTTGSGGNGQKQAVGSAAAAFTVLCKRYQPGDRYGGDWGEGVFHGEGVLVTSNFTYQGGWREGLMHGKGTISYTRKYVEVRPATAAGGSDGSGNSSAGGMGTLLLKGLSYVTPFELVATAAAPKEYFGTFDAEHGRHGTGLMRYYNGDTYEGEWRDNCRHGKGKLRKLDGEIYEGEWLNDVRHGYGKIMYPNGSLFKGLMQQDQRNGEGVMRFANGDEYLGHFACDRIEGYGTMKYRNGDVYDGSWHNQLRHGQGKFTLKRTGATMTGTFQNGLIYGEGTVVVPGVSTFVGTFVRGERTVGTMHWHQQTLVETDGKDMSGGGVSSSGVDTLAADSPATAAPASASSSSPASVASPTSPYLNKGARNNYLCYQGEWHGEHMNGKGLLWYTNGDFFSGRFKKSLRHGPGNMRYFAEQAEFSGQFVHDVRHGLGLLQRSDGSIRAGRWQHNMFVEGYEGEWDGTVFHGIGRLTIPLSTFFGLRARNSTMKLTDMSALLNASSSPPPQPLANNTAAEDELRNTSDSNSRLAEGVLFTSPNSPGTTRDTGSVAVFSDALRRANLSPHFIDFFGTFRNGVRDGVGMLKLPALDCLVGGTLNLADSMREMNKGFSAHSSNASTSQSNRGGGGGPKHSQEKGSSAKPAPRPDGTTSVPSVVIKGRWLQEVLHCEKGVLAFPNGIVYIGSFHNGARDSSCARVWWPDGSVMESGWRDDAPSGPGVWYQRNRMGPIFQTIVPSVWRRSQSRRITDSPTPVSATDTKSTQVLKSSGNYRRNGNSSTAADLFGLSYLWGLVGFGFGNGDRRNGTDEDNDTAKGNGDDEENKPQRVLIDFHNHFAISCAWYPYAMDLSTYARVVLPHIAAQTAPLENGTPWPLMMHSSTMSTATSSDAPSQPGNRNSNNISASHLTTTSFTATQQQVVTPTTRQIGAGATALYLSEPPPKISVGRANGPAVVYFDSGVVLAGEWLSNAPRLAVPYRPWSAYDDFLVWQAGRPAARNCMLMFPLRVAPRAQSCYSTLLATAPDDARGEPKRTTPGVYQSALSVAFSPLATGGNVSGGESVDASAPAAMEGVSGVTSPVMRCTMCAKEYSFFRKRVHCTLCLRSACSSCLGQMDTDGQQQEDVKAILRHAYVMSEQTEQLAAAVAKSITNSTGTRNANNISSSGATRRIVFPSISVEQTDRAFEAKSISTLPVCADCVRAMLWKLRYTQLWIPTSMFASVVEIDRQQQHIPMHCSASANAKDAPKENSIEGKQGVACSTATAVHLTNAPTKKVNADGPLAPEREVSHESFRQFSTGSELLPASQVACDKTDHDTLYTPTSSSKPSVSAGFGDSPVPHSPPPSLLSAEASVDNLAAAGAGVDSSLVYSSESTNRYARTPHDRPRPSGELLPPTQYITYSGYTSYSIPHIYGELWWGRHFYYRGGFCAGERHGFGVQYMSNGERYEGAFQRDAWHGQGVYYLEDGSVLMGEFRRGQLHDVKYHGEVEEDTTHGVRQHGRGIGYEPDGSSYNGEWVHGQRHGTGMLRFPDGVSVYSGTFVANAMEGMGKLVTTSGAYYGDFSQNQQQGKGLLFTSNCVVEGSWVHGMSSGFTRIYESSTGEVYETTYRDGNERDDCFSAPIMVDDAEATECGQCGTSFSFFLRRHHCRLCGDVFCDSCSQQRATLPANFAGDGDTGANAEGLNAPINPNTIGQRVCDACFYRLTQRRMIALRRYKDGSIYAGCWSQGRWVSRGLYCRPDGIYVVMDTHGHPLISADMIKAKTATVSEAGGGTDGKSRSNENAEEQGKKASAGVPPGGIGVPRRPARTMLPLSPSILQDASPAKEVLDNASVIKESSSRKDLDSFLMWWATTQSRCGLQVPLDVSLVSKYQHMPPQLLRGGRSATVTVGSEAAIYLTCPAQCTLSAPHTPSLAPIRLFVTMADSRKAMQAVMDGIDESTTTPIAADSSANQKDTLLSAEGVERRADENSGKEEGGSSLATPTLQAPHLTTIVRRAFDSDVEAAALRASRFMPVVIPRAPNVPITAATVSTTSMAAPDCTPSLVSTASARDMDRAAEQEQKAVGFGSGFGRRTTTATVDVEGSAYGLTAWATRPPPSIDEEDITDEKLMAIMREERLAWPSATPSFSSVGPLMPPTPKPPELGENTTISWDVWTTREIPRYAPPPLVSVLPDGDASTSQSAPFFSASQPSRPQTQPRSEADLYFSCPFWEPTVPDAQHLLEQGKMSQAAQLMRRLQRGHQATENGGSISSGYSEGDVTDDDADKASAAGTDFNKWLPNPHEGANGKKCNDAPDTLDALQQMQAANSPSKGGPWAIGGLLSAEQRAKSGGGWAPAPMHGPFTFEISTSQKKRSADGQRWYFKVHQREVSNFQ